MAFVKHINEAWLKMGYNPDAKTSITSKLNIRILHIISSLVEQRKGFNNYNLAGSLCIHFGGLDEEGDYVRCSSPIPKRLKEASVSFFATPPRDDHPSIEALKEILTDRGVHLHDYLLMKIMVHIELSIELFISKYNDVAEKEDKWMNENLLLVGSQPLIYNNGK